MFWGLTPALDLQEELKANGALPEELNILIIGGADTRHVLKTLARRYRHEKVKINFFLVEPIMEVVAKQLLLLNIALQPEEELGSLQKARYFMELYGNTLVRPTVDKYLKLKAYQLVEMITNLDYLKEIMPFIKLDLKFKERDYLESVFKFWCSSDNFDICDSWDRRMRKQLGIRYDSREGAFEWDLHMRFHYVGGNQVCTQEYTYWRGTGVAFTWLESEVSRPNRTLVCGIIPNGQNFAHYGYLGDMQTGPFVTFGLECEDPDFLKKSNGMNAQRATDVTERNLRQIFYEIENNKEYVHQKLNDINLGSARFVRPDINVVDVRGAGDVVKTKSKKCTLLEDCTINFLNIKMLESFKYKTNFHNFFNVIYFGSTYLKYLDGSVVEAISAPKSLLLIENQVFVLSHREKQLNEFYQSVQSAVEGIESLVETPFDMKIHPYIKFILKG